ncbi:flavin reductase family protein [bacterium]|nr:flavin reductase family protein [bacterium]
MKKSLGAHTLLHPVPVYLVGTYDLEGRPNIMTVSWGGIVCSRPPCAAVSLTKRRHSFEGMEHNKEFTISVPSVDQAKAADFAGLFSGRDVDKFAKAGLTPVRSEHVNAPYVDECPLVLECRLLRTIELGLHTQFIGEILDVKADESVLAPDGMPDIEKLRPFIYAIGTKTYHAIGDPIGKAFEMGKELGE